jgi:hypothetical protein
MHEMTKDKALFEDMLDNNSDGFFKACRQPLLAMDFSKPAACFCLPLIFFDACCP